MATGRHLVIVESPAKARTIGRYLGDDYTVEASVGHIRDLPQPKDLPADMKKGPFGRFAVDVENDFEPYYVVDPDKKKKVAELKRLMKDADTLYLATDEDREACGGHIDFALECTGAMPVVAQAIDCIGMLGTAILVGGAPAGAEITVDHQSVLWGKRIIGTLGGGSTNEELITALIGLYRQGRFPFDELVRMYELADVEQAIADSVSGEVIKPVLRISEV